MGIERREIEQELEGLGQWGPAERRRRVAGWVYVHLFGLKTDILYAVSSDIPGLLGGAHAAYLVYFVGQREVVEEIIKIVCGVICQ